MKPHNYFWSIFFIITIWLVKIYIISLFNYSITSIIIIECILFALYLIPLGVIIDENIKNNENTSQEESLCYILVFSNIIIISIYVVGIIFNNIKIKINNPITKFNNYLDKKFTKK